MKKTILFILTTIGFISFSTADEKLRISNYISKNYKISHSEASRIVEASYLEAEKHDLPPSLIIGLIEHESSYRKSVVSPAKAVGLMQVVPRYHRERISRITEQKNQGITGIESNIAIGTEILKQNINKYGNVARALQAYNGSHYSTRYSKVVLNNQRKIEKILKPM